MAGVIKNKKSIFEDKAPMPPKKKHFAVTEAENGFIVRCGEYDSKDKVAKNLAQVIKLLKEEFKDETPDDDSEDD